MNSLNILSSRVIGQTTNNGSPNNRPRSHSHSRGPKNAQQSDLAASRSYSEGNIYNSQSFAEGEEEEKNALSRFNNDGREDDEEDDGEDDGPLLAAGDDADEKTALLSGSQRGVARSLPPRGKLRSLAQRVCEALTETLKAILSALASPAVYVARCFRDEEGRYSPFVPLRRIRRHTATHSSSNKNTTSAPAAAQAFSAPQTKGRKGSHERSSSRKLRSSKSKDSLHSNTSDSEPERRGPRNAGNHRRTRSTASQIEPSEEDVLPRRSIRIKLNNEEKHPKRRKESRSSDDADLPTNLAAESLKSPISPSVHKFTKYPHAPVPPRPLIPQRQPSYTTNSTGRLAQKTLVLDLDETLIHSLAKGGRMSSGHMVEVKLSTPMTTNATPGGPPMTIGPQHPILYYVHKRPHCDEFLRKICKWYKLVIFTASVQEYADPVIDWLEQERKYFQGRYYRQHCTLRNGAYIKDLSFIEPDLSKVMILDNSPMSYIFHEDNAIPIEGWISDPTDNDLLHLVPILEGLQYVTDVRALLSLRRGEVET